MANRTKKYGLVGYPLGHSFSKDFFARKFAAEGTDAEYVNFEIDNISRIVEVLADGVDGLNVTIPYKQQIIPYLDRIDPAAQRIGAVNVVKIERIGDGKVTTCGYNSDIVGFTESIRPMLDSRHRRALILGTGGASKAVCCGLEDLGLESTYVSRRAGEGMLTYADLTEEVFKQYQVIVNTTPLGMYPHVDTLPDIPYSLLTPDYACFDLVYNPETTRFLHEAARNGAATRNGMEMLILQALESWRIWNM
ncbi:MAG: shikimate dehydrogenase family protein [Candidatus Limisoma sp.]